MKYLKYLVLPIFLSSCSIIGASNQITTTSSTTTTLYLGDSCNSKSYIAFSSVLWEDYNNFFKYTGGEKLSINSNVSNAAKHLRAIKFNLVYLDSPPIENYLITLIESIDSVMNSINSYFSYPYDPQSTLDLNNSVQKFIFDFESYMYDYKNLCSKLASI